MELYSGSARDFRQDVELNRLVDKMTEAWFAFHGTNAPPNEVRAWRNSLRAFKDVLALAAFETQGILVEYRLPMNSKRIDCLLTGYSAKGRETASVIELKQWEAAAAGRGERVVTFIGGGNRLSLHPAVQANQYKNYLLEGHTAFYGPEAIDLVSCSYLHNYTLKPDDVLLEERFGGVLAETPLFDARGVEGLRDFLAATVGKGDGRHILERVQESRYRPSRPLMAHVGRIIAGQERYILLDEQLVAFDLVKSVLAGLSAGRKGVVVVQGGPGTGKSAIAIQLLAHFLAMGRPAHYATGSKAFNETLWAILGRQSRQLIRYFHQYGSAPPDSLDLLILDEAHRIRETSNHRFTRSARRSTKTQLRELLESAKLCVFFLDPAQVVRPDEVGSIDAILAEAQALGAETHVLSLDAQFRCGGSDSFVNWVDNTLEIRKTANGIWEGADGFDFRIVGSPQELQDAIEGKARQGFTARMTAGYCWPWSKTVDADGSLRLDIDIAGWRRPWNARPDLVGLREGIPPAHLWAYDPGGAGQVGCVYTAQGFEFDYVGVIWGRDLSFDWSSMGWKGDRGHNFDRPVKRHAASFLANVKNTYRVLLTRGVRGCYVYFEDKGTERFVRSRMGNPLPNPAGSTA